MCHRCCFSTTTKSSNVLLHQLTSEDTLLVPRLYGSSHGLSGDSSQLYVYSTPGFPNTNDPPRGETKHTFTLWSRNRLWKSYRTSMDFRGAKFFHWPLSLGFLPDADGFAHYAETRFGTLFRCYARGFPGFSTHYSGIMPKFSKASRVARRLGLPPGP